MMQRQGGESKKNLIPDEFKVKITDDLLPEREIDTESHRRETEEQDPDYKPTDDGRVLFIEQKSKKLTKIMLRQNKTRV